MSRRILDFDDPERFVAGTLGEPGDRVFFLQASAGSRVAFVALEKEQLEILAERVLVMIDELERRGLAAIDARRPVSADPAASAGSADRQPGGEPPREEFSVETLTIAWDEDVDRLVIEARSHVHDDGAGVSASLLPDDSDDEVSDDAPIGPDVLRVHLRPVKAQSFARQAQQLAAAGRPPCPFCGQPLDATGHICPRPDGPDYVH